MALVIEPSKAFCCLGKVLIMPKGMYNDFWAAFAIFYERNDDLTLVCICNIGIGLVNNTPLLFCIESLLKLLYIDFSC